MALTRTRTRLSALASLAFALLFGSPAGAQWTSGDRVRAPASDLVATDGAWATSLDPAALAFLESWELAILHQESAPTGGPRGEAVYAATKLPFRLALGGGVEWRHGGDLDGGRASLALAWAKSTKLAFGGALRWIAAEQAGARPGDIALRQRVGLDLAATWRPRSDLGAALILEDLLGPAGLVRGEQTVPFRAILAGQLRPFHDDRLIFELAAAVDTTGALGGRGSLSLRIDRLGRLSAIGEVSELASGDPEWRFAGALALDFGGGVRVEGGGGTGDGDYWFAGARLRGAERATGIHVAEHVDDLEIRGSLNERRILALIHRLEKDRVDPRVRGVFLRLRNTDMAMAYAQEVREAIAALEEADKPVVCHLDAGGGSELYACGPARETLVDPAGGVRLMGPSIHVMLYGEALARYGVDTDFVRIGRFKSAVESYTRGTMSGPARRQREAFLDDVQARFVADLARDREVPMARVQAWIDGGPYAAGEATEAELLHDTADERAMGPRLEAIFGTSTLRKPRARVERTAGVAPRVGVVVIDGSIVDGDNVDLPLVNIHRTGSRTLVRSIEAMAADPSVRAIVVRIDSPGGSALASDQIWRALRRAARHKPVVGSMGAVAASGGYYVASACDTIFAVPTTVTGSIGIFFGKGDFSPLAESLGVHVEPLSRGRRAGAESLWRPFTADERAVLADKIRLWYRLFLRRIATGRDMPVERIHELGQGRIWSGDAAHSLGLVDELGGFGAALAHARRLGHLPPDSDVVLAPGRPSTLLEYLLGSVTPDSAATAEAEEPAAIAPALVEAAGMAVSLSGDGTVPMALMPATISVR